MRNYPAFPRATPHQWAGSPRVPHPSATLSPEGATFDLHALGTPPALILSQDQTLHQNCFACPSEKATGLCFTLCVRHPRCAPLPSRPNRTPGSPDASVLHLRPPLRPSDTPHGPPGSLPILPSTRRAWPGNQPVKVLRCHQRAGQKKTALFWAGSAWPRTRLRLGSDRLRRSTKRHPPVTRPRTSARVSTC